MSNRHESLEERVRQVLSNSVLFDVRDPGLEGAMVTAVRLSRDQQFADVRFSLGADDLDPRQAEQAFERASGFLRRQIANSVPLRRIPELRFHFDEQALAERRIGQILSGLEIRETDDSEE
jgi:ribosome-binding factor A